MNNRTLTLASVAFGGLLVAAVVGATAGPSSAAAPTEFEPRNDTLSVVLTFDDLVGQSTRRDTETYAGITNGILAALSAADAPAIGFVNESKLYVDDELVAERVDMLRQWLDGGFSLGNHTYSHINLHEATPEEWLSDMDRGGVILEQLWADQPPTTRFIRHPYLRTGRTPEVKAAIAQGVEERGYEVAPVSIDNAEWIFARAYDIALDRSDTQLATDVIETYVTYMDDIFAYFEEQSDVIVGRQIKQILLLHANRLNADALPQLIDAIRARGYRFIDLEEALEDVAYTRPDGYFGPAGITWLHRWAMAEGMPGSTFRGEPTPPDWIHDLTGLR